MVRRTTHFFDSATAHDISLQNASKIRPCNNKAQQVQSNSKMLAIYSQQPPLHDEYEAIRAVTHSSASISFASLLTACLATVTSMSKWRSLSRAVVRASDLRSGMSYCSIACLISSMNPLK